MTLRTSTLVYSMFSGYGFDCTLCNLSMIVMNEVISLLTQFYITIYFSNGVITIHDEVSVENYQSTLQTMNNWIHRLSEQNNKR